MAQRFCKQFYCDERGDRYCCADCRLRDACLERCLNWPHRCGCSAVAEIDSRGNTIHYHIIE